MPLWSSCSETSENLGAKLGQNVMRHGIDPDVPVRNPLSPRNEPLPRRDFSDTKSAYSPLECPVFSL